jgi:nitrate reductase gamma subunit
VTWWSKVLALVAAALVMVAFLSALSELLSKKIFGRRRSRAGKSLDQLLLIGLVLAGTLIGLYACYGG